MANPLVTSHKNVGLCVIVCTLNEIGNAPSTGKRGVLTFSLTILCTKYAIVSSSSIC